MFFEEAEIDEILKCEKCTQKFDEPRNLPCGKIVCNSCLDTALMSIDEKNNSFMCPLCQADHKNGEFPVSELIKKLLGKSSAEVYRGDLVEKFKSNLKEIEAQKIKIEYILKNSVDMIKEHCIELRCDVDLATEMLIRDIQKQRDVMIQQIDDYEAKTIELLQTDNKDNCLKMRFWNWTFEKKILELGEFSKKWRSYLKKVKIDDEEVANTNELAVTLRKEGQKTVGFFCF